MPHYTDSQLNSMYEQSKRDHAQWVGSEIRCLVADIREARAALSDAPVAQEPVAFTGQDVLDQVKRFGAKLTNLTKHRTDMNNLGLYTSPPATPAGVGVDEISEHSKKLMEVAAILSTERIQGWANPLVTVLTDAVKLLKQMNGEPEQRDDGDALLSRGSGDQK